MSLMIGHASIDEHNKIQGGSAGDQSGREVCTRAYYLHSKGWYVLRPKSVKIANAIASAMLEACANRNIGYDQSNRLGVIIKLRSYKTLKKIGVKTEADCSSLVRACCIQAGFDPGNFTTYNEATVLEQSGFFESKKEVTSSTTLYNGDVLVTKTKGHTAVVVSGNPRKASKKSKTYSGTLPSLPTKGYLSNGDIGSRVGKLQAFLNWYGNYGLALDNEFGAKTEKAVKAFQKAEGLVVDGEFGVKSLNKAKAYVR